MNHPIRLLTQLPHHLRALRMSRGLSQAQLGERLGLSQSRIARMERAPELISVEALHRLLLALGAMLVISEPDAPSQPATADTAAKPRSARPSPSAKHKAPAAARKAAKSASKPPRPTRRPVPGDW